MEAQSIGLIELTESANLVASRSEELGLGSWRAGSGAEPWDALKLCSNHSDRKEMEEPADAPEVLL